MSLTVTNHRNCLRAAKGNITKVGKDLAHLEELDCEALDVKRVDRLIDSLNKAKDSFELHLLATYHEDEGTTDKAAYDHELTEQQLIYDQHLSSLQGLLCKHAAVTLIAELSLALDELEFNSTTGYSSALSHDLDYAAGLAHKVRQARSKPAVRHCPEISSLGDKMSKRLFSLQQLKDEFTEARASPHTSSTTVIRAPTGSTGVNALKLDLPTFNGQIDKWNNFWKLLSALFAQHPELTEEAKQAHIIKQMGTRECREKAEAAFAYTPSYSEAIKRLRTQYEKPRDLLRHYVQDCLSVGRYHNKKSEITELADTIERNVAGMKKIDSFTASQFLATYFVRAMEPDLLAHWGKATEKHIKPPTVEELIDFLRTHCEGVPSDDIVETPEASARPKRKPRPEKSVLRINSKSPSSSNTSSTTSQTVKCSCCSLTHSLYSCPQFRRKSCQQRWDLVKEKDLCYNCLHSSHRSGDCNSKFRCHECDAKHHTLLHESRPPKANKNGTVDASIKVANGKTTVTTHCSVPRTAVAEVQSSRFAQRGRILLDSGAEVSLITRTFATKVRADKIPHSSTEISGVEGSFISPYRVSLTLKGNDGELIDAEFHIVDRIDVSSTKADMREVFDLPFLQDLEMSDPEYTGSARIDILLDMGTSLVCSRDEFRRSESKYLRAESTVFGWTVGGRHDITGKSAARAPKVLKIVPSEENLDDLLQKQWDMERFPSDVNPLSSEEQQALDQFNRSVCRESDGRYSVSLPKKTPTIELGESRGMALRRTLSTEKSLKRKGDWTRYQEAAAEYGRLGHAEKVPEKDLSKPCKSHYYLPVHAVSKPSSTSTKYRLVFDASAKTSNGVSLNDTLLPGPSVYPLLPSVLIRFRSFKIGMTSDIAKMFRGVGLNESDRDYHRFFIRNEEGLLEEWRMNRVTFGVTSSPFLASQVLLDVANQYQDEYPDAAEAIRSCFYVDDCLIGADDISTARHLREEINEIFEKPKMVVCKWRTSCPELTDSIPEHLRETDDFEDTPPPDLCPKALGIHWSSKRDTLHIATPTIGPISTPTKRTLLSTMARVFDVLGWFSPALLTAKLLTQEAWKLGLGWETPLPDDIRQQLEDWCAQLPLLTAQPIPRFYHDKDRTIHSVQLHGFADASTKGYGGVIYIRTFYTDSTVSIALVTSRGRVVPTKKPPTIPRLELCAALITARLLECVASILSIPTSSIFAWSDSTAVLGWINQPPLKLKKYVSNRVSKLTDFTPPSAWRYVTTNCNPADCLSRGMCPQALISSSLWWRGPPWLSQDPAQWPRRPDINLGRELPDMRPVILKVTPTEPELGSHISSFSHLVRVTAWMWRFYRIARDKTKRLQPPNPSLSLLELLNARTSLIRHSQQTHFSTEYRLLEKKAPLPNTSSLSPLVPFLDKNNLLRVGGRLQNAGLNPGKTHPLILSTKSHIVVLLIRHIHHTLLHAGPATMMAVLSQTYHVPRIKQLLRKMSHDCVTCQTVYAKSAKQMMGELPEARVTHSRAFADVGIDFAGPVTLKEGAPRKPRFVKAYLCVFVCFSSRAIHLEVVSDLSTDAFLAALTRFTGRRGVPSNVHSDNGSNFIGAEAELKNIQALIRAQETKDAVTLRSASRNVVWHFTPARAPHFGGLWEAAVRAMKNTLKKVLKDRTLNFEEMTTVVIEAEAMLNSRPLIPTDSPSDEATPLLTAGHFLIGAPLASLPALVDAESKITLLRRWNLTKRLTHDVWARWSAEYLTQLQRRSKWRQPQRQMQINDLVLVKDAASFNRVWPRGRVCQTYPGKDGLVRVVDVQMNGKVYRRPITKLCLIHGGLEEPPSGEYVRASSQCSSPQEGDVAEPSASAAYTTPTTCIAGT